MSLLGLKMLTLSAMTLNTYEGLSDDAIDWVAEATNAAFLNAQTDSELTDLDSAARIGAVS